MWISLVLPVSKVPSSTWTIIELHVQGQPITKYPLWQDDRGGLLPSYSAVGLPKSISLTALWKSILNERDLWFDRIHLLLYWYIRQDSAGFWKLRMQPRFDFISLLWEMRLYFCMVFLSRCQISPLKLMQFPSLGVIFALIAQTRCKMA